MDKPRFLFPADDRNLDSAGFIHSLQHSIPIYRFAQRARTDGLCVRNGMFFQFLFKFRKRLYRLIDGMRGYGTFRKHILPEAHRRAYVVNGLISSVTVHVCDTQPNSVGPDINGSDCRHESG